MKIECDDDVINWLIAASVLIVAVIVIVTNTRGCEEREMQLKYQATTQAGAP